MTTPRLIPILLLCACFGCTTQRPTLRSANAAAPAAAIAPQPKTITLAWDNPNPPERALVTEIHSTTDLLRPFTLKCVAGAGQNSVTLQPTNTCEFFIARFLDPATWEHSAWNVK